jgi:transcriptional regulator with XRE-family HTH domain
MSVSLSQDGVRERRLAAGLTQDALARKARVSRSLVQIVEAGYRPSEAMARRLDRALTRVEEVNATR